MSGIHRSRQLTAQVWTPGELDRHRLEAISIFQRERLEEPLERYLDQFDSVQSVIEELFESTIDLTQLREQASEILSTPEQLEGFGPPISLDDLRVLAENNLSRKALRNDPDVVRRAIDTILEGLDRRRFPWIVENRDPTPTERDAAVIATAAMIAMRRTETERRNTGKNEQEERVEARLLGAGFKLTPVASGYIRTLSDAPKSGEFCREVQLGERKADLVVGLWDGRVMPIECKVSNSSTNSIKRINNDAAVKAKTWSHAFGVLQVVPTAVLSGVYKRGNLEQAQRDGLTLYWAHRLDDLVAWIDKAR